MTDDRQLYSLVVSQAIGHNLTYVVQHDHAWQNHGSSVSADSEWYGVNQYLLLKLNCKWTAGLRLEWFRDDDGTRVTGLQAGNPIAGNTFAGNFWELTFGFNIRTDSNAVIRPEVRYDWYDGRPDPGGNLPFADGRDGKQFTMAMDMIWRY